MAKKARVYDGTAWQELASAQTDLTAYSTTAQMNAAIGVYQVKSTTKTDTFSTTSATFTDITGLSVNITPTSSSNKVLVTASVSAACDPTLTNISFQLVRGSTVIAVGDAASSRIRATIGTKSRDNDTPITQTIMFLDSPATTSSTTYKLQVKVSGSTGYINRSVSDVDSAGRDRTISTITVMEVAP